MANSILFILDWDDTLFPTTWFSTNSNSSNCDNALRKLDNLLVELLTKMISFGSVFIVTNANMNWIISSKNLLPNTSRIIDMNITIISAREMYQYVYDMSEWKVRAFKNGLYNDLQYAEQIISIGDSNFEYNALVSLHDIVDRNVLLKNIKLVDEPLFDIVIEQILIINKSLLSICSHSGHLDLNIKIL